MKILSVVGARPTFVKLAPFAQAIKERASKTFPSLEHVIVHTGQHYDPEMSDVFFSELELPSADFHLSVGSGNHGSQTGRMLSMIEWVLREVSPDIVVVYGDTNSALAGALAGAKLNIPVAHVESGLRSFNRRMPEEINRIVADHVCDLLLAPTPAAMRNLSAEALSARAMFTGELMYDAVLLYRKLANQRSQIGTRLGLKSGEFSVVTAHRAENTDNLDNLRNLLDAFNELATEERPFVFPVHPRTTQKITTELSDWHPTPHVRMLPPVGYLDMLWLIDHADVTLTDSGGLQREAFFLGCPCITLREETEWVETTAAGRNILAGTDVTRIRTALDRWRKYPSRESHESLPIVDMSFGNGDAANRILDALLQFLERMEFTDVLFNRPAAVTRG